MNVRKILIDGVNDYFLDTNGNIYYVDNSLRLLYKTLSQGYYYVHLYFKDGTYKTYRLHRLIAMTFIPVPDRHKNIPIEKLFVNHIDGNKLNNKVENLEWCTSSENMIHAYKNNLWSPLRIQKHSVLVDVYDLFGNKLYENITISETSRRLKCSVSSVTRAYKEYNGLLKSKNVIIKCNDYPSADHIK